MDSFGQLLTKIESTQDVRGLLESLEDSLKESGILDYDKSLCLLSGEAVKILDRAEALY